MAGTGPTTRRTFTNLKDQQQLRELNRQMDWIWGQLLGGLTEKSFSFGGTVRMVETVQEKIATNLTADHVSTKTLQAALADLLVAQIGVAEIDWAHITDLNAQIISATTAEIQNLTAADISTNTLYAAFAHLLSLAAGSIQAGTLSADSLAAVLANIITMTARTVDVDYLHVKDLTADEAIIQDGLAGEFFMDRLAVTRANMLNAVIGNLILQSSNGNYYAIHIGSDGSINTEQVTVTQSEITAGQTSSGRDILATTVNAASLNGTTVKASEAILDTILTTALTAGSITAAEALIASAQIPMLYSTAIRALGDTIDISANRSITMTLGKAETAQAEAESLLAYFSFDNNGLRTRKTGSKWSTLVGDDGFYIDHDEIAGHVSAFYRDKVVVDGLQIGDIVAIKTEKGGWAWVSA